MTVSPKTIALAATFAASIVAPSLLLAGDARAQGGAHAPLTSYPPCTMKPTAQDSEAAHSAFLLGKRFFEEADYASASHNFMDAFKLDCTKPELLLNIARATELLGDRAEAIHALETYLQVGTALSPDDRAQYQRRIDNLKAAMNAQASTAPAATPPAPAPVPQAAPAPAAAAPEERHHTIWPWIVVGAGGAAVVSGVIVFFVGNGDINKAENTCPGGVCPNPAARNATITAAQVTAAEDLNSKGDGLRTAGSVVFWSGIAVAGGGLLWHFLEPTGPSGANKASLTPSVGPGYAGLAAVGTF